MPETLEGEIIKIADKIAYINHDIDDAIRAKIISKEQIPTDLNSILGKRDFVRFAALFLPLPC